MSAQQGYFDTLKSIAGKVLTYLASITLTGTDGSILTVSGDATVGQAPIAWTPVITFGCGNTGITYHASNGGSYVKIGKLVVFSGRLLLTSKGSSAGDAVIGGLPFAAENFGYSHTPVALEVETVTFASQIFGTIRNNAVLIDLTETTEAGVVSTINETNFADDSEIRLAGSYFTP